MVDEDRSTVRDLRPRRWLRAAAMTIALVVLGLAQRAVDWDD
jgi:hypothetical protein